MSNFSKIGFTFSQVPIGATLDTSLNDASFRLLAYLIWRQGSGSGCWPSIAKIAEDMHLSTRSVQRNLNTLEGAGYLTRTKRDGRSTLYAVIATPDRNDTGGVTTVSPTPDIPVTQNDIQERETKEPKEPIPATPGDDDPLAISTPADHAFFDPINEDRAAKRFRPITKYQSVQQRDMVREAASLLGEDYLQDCIGHGLRTGITAVGKLAAYANGAAKKRGQENAAITTRQVNGKTLRVLEVS